MARFLIVDDSKIGRHMASHAVSTMGHEVVGEAVDGIEAISKYKELLPEFVIMDINMPNMDGITAAREISRQYSDAKIFMLTSESDIEVRHSAIKSGVLEYLVKPLNIDELRDKIKRNL